LGREGEEMMGEGKEEEADGERGRKRERKDSR
jgi:hypothetical protein